MHGPKSGVSVDVWLKALRSGEYPQTKGVLRSTNGFCCLGVYEEISGTHWHQVNHVSGAPVFADDAGGTTMPWIDLFPFPISIMVMNFLASSNDEGLTFNQIADLIEYLVYNAIDKGNALNFQRWMIESMIEFGGCNLLQEKRTKDPCGKGYISLVNQELKDAIVEAAEAHLNKVESHYNKVFGDSNLGLLPISNLGDEDAPLSVSPPETTGHAEPSEVCDEFDSGVEEPCLQTA